MNLQSNPLLSSSSDPAQKDAQLQILLRQFAQQVNALSSGKISAVTNASTTIPADGTGNPGDFVQKTNPVAQGPTGAPYVLVGWRCVSTGGSTQWLEVIESVRIPVGAPAPTPAPSPAPAPAPAYTQKIQAENATLHGITAVTTIAGYEGTGHADWFRSGYDEYLEFSFTGAPTGAGNLTLRYANYGDQTITILLNGATSGTMYTFPASPGATWTTKVISGVSFVSGTNTVRLTPVNSGYTYFDYAQFDQTTGAPPPPPPAPAPTPAPPAAPAPAPAPGSAPFYPFGSRLDAYGFGIKVSSVTTAQQDLDVKACYDNWKLARLAKSPNFTPVSGIFKGVLITDGYHVQWGTSAEATRSEGMGYGMLITVVMAGYDANAKVYFDGMYRVVRGCPAIGLASKGSAISDYQMDYRILPDMSSGDGWPAQDGDMDIALALLMAHRQWGSSGAINYYQQALNTINAMKATPQFTSGGISIARNVSRVSDYMAGHFRSFKKATNDTFWDDARTNSLTQAQNITTNFSPSAKLQPGFIYDPLGTPKPDNVVRLDRSGIEDIYDENSIRNPWRWGADFVHSGDAGWGTLAKNIVTQMQTNSGGSASSLCYAYRLDGTPYANLYKEPAQGGCLMAGCAVDATLQTFMNTLYAASVGSGFDTRYFKGELQLLPLFVVTGNWWRP